MVEMPTILQHQRSIPILRNTSFLRLPTSPLSRVTCTLTYMPEYWRPLNEESPLWKRSSTLGFRVLAKVLVGSFILGLPSLQFVRPRAES